MRRLLGIVLLLVATPAWAKDEAAAKAANARGMALYKQKDYKGAGEQFRAAILADPVYVQARYNLACVASLLHDDKTTVDQLTWIGNRASWDSQARAKTLKAGTDPDLAWIRNADMNAESYVGQSAVAPRADLLKERQTLATATLVSDADHAHAASLLASMPEKHDDNCDPKDPKQGRIYGVSVPESVVGKKGVTLLGSLRDGLGLIDQAGKLVARSEPLGCTTPGASQDVLSLLSIDRSQAVSIYIAQYGNGGRNQWANNVAIFVQRGTKLERVFDATVSSSESTGAARLIETPLGDIVFTAPGQTRPRVMHWNAVAFRFEDVE